MHFGKKLAELLLNSSAIAFLLTFGLYISSVGLVFQREAALEFSVFFVILVIVLIAVLYLYTGLEKGKPEKSILVCPTCGSYDLSRLKGDRRYPWIRLGRRTKYVCQDCDYQGMPLELDSKEDYQKFMELKKKEKADAMAESISKEKRRKKRR
jgi:hypothetical protein